MIDWVSQELTAWVNELTGYEYDFDWVIVVGSDGNWAIGWGRYLNSTQQSVSVSLVLLCINCIYKSWATLRVRVSQPFISFVVAD